MPAVPGYTHLSRVGEGTYGVVYSARDEITGAVVALKRLRSPEAADGLTQAAAREMRALQRLRGATGVVRLLRVVAGERERDGSASLFLALEWAPFDLGRVLDAAPRPFDVAAAKRVAQGVLAAVDACHAAWTLHRDVKASNVLLTEAGGVRLCDFGLARTFGAGGGDAGDGPAAAADDGPLADPPRTPRVVTLWYRAPELLFGGDEYGEGVDAWAAGCVVGELLRGEPLFPAASEAALAAAHAALLGAPSPRIWPGLPRTPLGAALASAPPGQPFNRVAASFPGLSPAGAALLNGLLTYDPSRRLPLRHALRSPWFREHPLPASDAAVAAAAASAVRLGGDAGARAALRAAADAAARPPADRRLAARVGAAFGSARRRVVGL